MLSGMCSDVSHRPGQSSVRAASWMLRTHTLDFSAGPKLMGVFNVTPDSFSDSGPFLDPQAALDQALQLEADGAAILDVGGESTRPYSDPVDADEELRRVIPVIQAICEQASVPVSIDTSKARVAAEAIEAGAEIINDVTGLEGDAGMLPLAVETGVGVCAMHMRGTPRTMQDDPRYDDPRFDGVVAEIYDYLRQRRDALLAAGIDPQRICLDPGIGFGKTHQHNITLCGSVRRFHDLGCPLLVGPSRKAFIGKVLGDKTADRTAGTIGVALALASQGVQIIRVHDVRPLREAMLLYEAVGGLS